MIRNRASTQERNFAFTIMEVLVGLALTALLLGAVVSLVAELGRQRTLITANWRAGRGADVVMDRLERDIAFAIVGDRQRGAGIRGTADSLTLLTRGVWVVTDGEGGSVPSPSHADLTRVEYRQASGSGGVEVRESLLGSAETERSGNIVDAAMAMRFRYLDGGDWKSEFDSLRRGRLPLAIEVTLWNVASAPNSDAASSGPEALPTRVRVIAIPDAKGEQP